jgi:hypothetical protein
MKHSDGAGCAVSKQILLSRSAAMSRQQLPGTFVNMDEEEKQANRFVAQPTG